MSLLETGWRRCEVEAKYLAVPTTCPGEGRLRWSNSMLFLEAILNTCWKGHIELFVSFAGAKEKLPILAAVVFRGVTLN